MNSDVIILHGWAYETSKWKPLVKLLNQSKLSSIQLRVPGLTADLDRAWTLDDYAHWFAQETKGQKKLVVIAHSNGGRIVIRFNTLYPHRLKKLILIDAAGIRDTSLKARFKRGFFGSLAKMGRPLKQIKPLRWLVYKILRERDYYQASGSTAQTMKNLIKEDLRTELSLIQVPTLIIWGSKDQMTPVAQAHIFNTSIPKSKLILIPEAGHAPFASHPQQVALEIERFIDAIN